ncbi:hypothetical protein [Gordonia alkaliphila]|uniref:DNA-damage-inducible protein D n=1 Tax=Gordonia alkaliphila TaxID=1053547 RepID=A0ABP8ZH42_9ACTN
MKTAPAMQGEGHLTNQEIQMQDISRHSGSAASPFDAIRREDGEGREYWSARAMQPFMGYKKWQDFQNAIERAKVAASNAGHDAEKLFVQVTQLMDAGNLGQQERVDYHLPRFACYLTFLNGDPRKPEVAAAQAYFAIRTREAETAPTLSQLDILAQAVAALQDQERRVAAAEAAAQHALDRVEAIMPASRGELYYSGRAWSRVRGADATLHYLQKLGAKAGVLGRAAGLEPDDVPDPRFGVVNGWPLHVWDRAHDAIQNGDPA